MEDGSDQHLVGGNNCFHLLAPGGAAEAPKDIDPRAGSGAEILHVCLKSEEWVERHPQDPGVAF